MSQTLQMMLEEIKNLSPDELTQLHHRLKNWFSPLHKEVFLEKLKEAGLLSEIKKPAHQSSTERVSVEGKPVSQTIIEERRSIIYP